MKKNNNLTEKNLTERIIIRVDPYLKKRIIISGIDVPHIVREALKEILGVSFQFKQEEIDNFKKEFKSKNSQCHQLQKKLNGVEKRVKEAEQEDIILACDLIKNKQKLTKELDNISTELIILNTKIAKGQENLEKKEEEELEMKKKVVQALKRRGLHRL